MPHLEKWLPQADADALYKASLGLSWEAREVVVFGRRLMQPRLTALVGAGYGYSGAQYAGIAIPEWLKPVLKAVSAESECEFNSVLFNRYRTGEDSIGWHSDNEPELGPDPTVASISLGSPRWFKIRPKTPPDPIGKVRLQHGDLLVMPSGFQARFQHSIPREARAKERVSLTFRRIQWLSKVV